MTATPRSRRWNERLVKTCRSYTVEQAATLLGVHKNTVRGWIRDGLPSIPTPRPAIILGRELAPFLKQLRDARKCQCANGQIYCLRCRCARTPAGLMADYLPISATGGNLVGICEVCEALMYRRVNYTRLAEVGGELEVQQTERLEHVDESDQPSVNSDFKRE